MPVFSPSSAEVHAAVYGLLAEFSWRVDNALGDTVAELFTEHATLQTPHFKLEGREKIDAWFSERATQGDRISRHHSTNVRITEIGPSRFQAQASAVTAVAAPPAPAQGAAVNLGTSTDVIVKTEAGWLFESRSLTVAIEGRFAMPEKAA